MSKQDTATRILDAARACLLADGFAALTTRKVAQHAGVPLSQIHYHFGSREDLILSLLRKENEALVGRQSEMFAREIPVWRKWEIACDYYDEDLASGYVRVLQEMTAAGWSSEPLGKEMAEIYREWNSVLIDLARETDEKGLLPPLFTVEEVAALVASAFLGAEALILLDMEGDGMPLRSALRKVGDLIRIAEEKDEG
ncbi:MAG: TetR/AcrR family transcriptional regulator [Actinomycetota bacterium]|nr:TetR/AcrR family transcriptional regulator [Actinomycetota bacterium]